MVSFQLLLKVKCISMYSYCVLFQNMDDVHLSIVYSRIKPYFYISTILYCNRISSFEIHQLGGLGGKYYFLIDRFLSDSLDSSTFSTFSSFVPKSIIQVGK